MVKSIESMIPYISLIFYFYNFSPIWRHHFLFHFEQSKNYIANKVNNWTIYKTIQHIKQLLHKVLKLQMIIIQSERTFYFRSHMSTSTVLHDAHSAILAYFLTSLSWKNYRPSLHNARSAILTYSLTSLRWTKYTTTTIANKLCLRSFLDSHSFPEGHIILQPLLLVLILSSTNFEAMVSLSHWLVRRIKHITHTTSVWSTKNYVILKVGFWN